MERVITESITIKAVSRLLTFIGSSDPSFCPGFKSNQAPAASKFINAEKTKKELAVPVSGTRNGMVTTLIKNGKIIALNADPMFPSMFMVAETIPELSPPMSIQSDQLGEMVISTPNTATEKSRVKTRGEWPGRRVMINNPAVAIRNPAIAGIFRERVWPALWYNKVVNHPENHWASIPNSKGTGA